MGKLTPEQFRLRLRKMMADGVKFKNAAENIKWSDPLKVLTDAKKDYIRRHNAEFVDALKSIELRDEIDAHLPDEIIEAMRPKPVGCFTRQVACCLFSSEELAKTSISKVNKEAKKRQKPGHPACGECDLYVAQADIAALAAHRRAKQQREISRQWANAQSHAQAQETSEEYLGDPMEAMEPQWSEPEMQEEYHASDEA
jgi:hypothetical protein